jgi:3D (Asp-Asp-Asp) domain-containing protein
MNIVSIVSMKDRLVWIILLITIGWFIGYMHHYLASRHSTEILQAQVETAEQEIRRLKGSQPDARKVKVKTTAYSTDLVSINVPKWRDNRTATNKRVRRGFVAADWRVFPPGTRFFIPGYGEAVVEDRGGAVKGNHLDLFVETRTEALEWGIRDIDVYILEDVVDRDSS